jgi:prevent-host-death family protein
LAVKTQWQLQEAKAKLSQLVQQAQLGLPQIITLHGEPAAVVLSPAAYEAMSCRRQDLIEWLAEPLLDDDSLFSRSRESGRAVDL